MKRRTKIKRWYRKNWRIFWCSVILLFPLVVGWIYSLPFPQVIAVEAGDLLSYYGVIFGLLGSFISYREDRKNREKERKSELKPIFIIDVVKSVDNPKLFTISIENQSKSSLSYLNLYDEFISTVVKNHQQFNVAYNLSIEEARKVRHDYNITMDNDIIDTDGYDGEMFTDALLLIKVDGRLFNLVRRSCIVNSR